MKSRQHFFHLPLLCFSPISLCGQSDQMEAIGDTAKWAEREKIDHKTRSDLRWRKRSWKKIAASKEGGNPGVKRIRMSRVVRGEKRYEDDREKERKAKSAQPKIPLRLPARPLRPLNFNFRIFLQIQSGCYGAVKSN